MALAGIFSELAQLARWEVMVARLRRSLLAQQAWRFVLVNSCCTVLTIALYLVLTTLVDQVVANVLAFAVTTVVSSTANRVITFGQSHTVSKLRYYTQSLLTFLYYCTSSTIALDLLGIVVTRPTSTEQAIAVCAVSVLGGAARFFLLRGWVFGIRTIRRGAASHAIGSPARAHESGVSESVSPEPGVSRSGPQVCTGGASQ